MTTRHMRLDIRGCLKNTAYPSGFRDLVRDDDGNTLSPEDAREWLLDELAKGHKFLPVSDCEGFSFETGCPGHETPE